MPIEKHEYGFEQENNIPEPKVCPKKIYGINWYEKLEKPKNKNVEGARELIRLMDVYWKYQIKDREEKREEFKETVRKQNEKIIEKESKFLKKVSPKVPVYYDSNIDYKNIDVNVKIANTKEEKEIWDYFRHIVSSTPHKGTVGKNLRFFLWDNTSETVLGIGALGSPLFSLKKREDYFGIESLNIVTEFKEEYGFSPFEFNVNAHTIVPLQPFGMFTGGKLITMLIATDEMMDIWENNYGRKPWGFHTTSLYGKSIQYDRLYDWDFVGKTKGYGTIHYSHINIPKILEYLSNFTDISLGTTGFDESTAQKGLSSLREISKALFGSSKKDDESFNYHGIGRGIYCCELWKNFNLKDWYHKNLEIDRTLHKYPNDESINHRQVDTIQNKFDFWKRRWFERRHEKYKSKVNKWSVEDYQYENMEKQSDLDKWF